MFKIVLVKYAWWGIVFAAAIILVSGTETRYASMNTMAGEVDSIPKVDSLARHFMKKYHVPGMSVAIAKDGRIVYAKGYGYANESAGELVTPSHLFRIASVSKPITSVAIFQLIEEKRLSLEAKVFGDNGILGNAYGEIPAGSKIGDITVHQLLQHISGGWANDSHDPMFTSKYFTRETVIRNTLKYDTLVNDPGKAYAYSNFGYCVLGRIIEKISGLPYAKYVQQNVLAKMGITDMRIAGNLLTEKLPNEVVYYGQNNEDPYRYNITRMDSHGGWIASAPDLLRFVFAVDGFQTKPDILQPATIEIMTTPSLANNGYACGWAVNTAYNWWHTGSLPGTATELVRANNGFAWAILANSRSRDKDFAGDMDRLIWYAVRDKSIQWVPVD